MKPFFCTYLITILVCVTAGGCSSSEVPAPPLEVGDVATHERAVFAATSRFYCARLRWPSDWDELVEFEPTLSAQGVLSDLFEEAELESPRAILLTLSYKQPDGSPRKVTFISPPSCVGELKKLDKGAVSIAGTGIVFRLPEDFSLMKGAAMKLRWRSPPYPDAAWSGSGDQIVAIRFGEVELDRDDTADFIEDVSKAYESTVPSLVWVSREVITVRKIPLLRHEFDSYARGGMLRSVVLSGSFDGRLFAVTVSGPTENATKITQTVKTILDTLSVR